MRTLDEGVIKKIQAEELVKLVKEHRERCKGDCDVSLSPLLSLYMMLIGRPPTKEEVGLFV